MKISNSIQFSFVIPAYNEAATIALVITRVLAAFDKNTIHGEVIVINDGSTDNTQAEIDTCLIQDKRIQCVVHGTCQGIGSAFRSGVLHAQGDIVVMIPGDNENDPVGLLQYRTELPAVDMVIPFVRNPEVRGFLRKTLSQTYALIIRKTFNIPLKYTNGTVLYRRLALLSCLNTGTGFFYQTEILVKMLRAGYRYKEVPVALEQRLSGKSKALTLKSFMNVMHGYFVLCWELYCYAK